MTISRRIQSVLYFAFALCASFACYKRPIAGEFDRYMYEVVARSLSENWADFHAAVKAESLRLAASPGFDSPEHMAELEPLYAIRPLYVEAIECVHLAGTSYQTSISLISAIAYFGMAVILFLWTRQPLLSALAISTPGLLELGRAGVPDGMNALVILAALYLLIARNRAFPGLLLLIASVWVRTDSVLVCCATLVWLCCRKRLELPIAASLATLALSSVAAINHFAGNYGYAALFRLTFIGGSHPLLTSISPVTLREYLRGISEGLPSIIPQLAPWILLSLAAWHFRSRIREWLLPIWSAALAHFALFPSPESRYLNWAMLFSAVSFAIGFAERISTVRESHLARLD